MSLLRIVTVKDRTNALRTRAQQVGRVDRRVRELMDDMVQTMRDAPGVGLAAPQVGVSLRVIVAETPIATSSDEEATDLVVLADPEIVWADPEVVEDQEACLSIPGLFGDVPRHAAVRVRGLDRSGRRIEIEAAGFQARVLQHEIDHLDGVLFTDRVTGFDKLYVLRENESGDIVRVPYRPPVPVESTA